MNLDRFIARWSSSGDAERANKDSFLNELCDVLGVERPHPKTGSVGRDLYVFEKDVARTRPGGVSTGRIDLYKNGCFLLEAKQGASNGPKRRASPAWNQMMSGAHGQALGYAAYLDEPPPFLLVCDIGYCFDVYASFDGTGLYRAFPDGHRKRIFLADLAVQTDLLRSIWTDPQALNPAKRTAAVTREIADQIAALARALESAGQDPEKVATFLMRCLFTMFAEDVGLLPSRPFSHALENWWIPNPDSFPSGVGSLWKAMDYGADYVTGKLLHFNGGLFSDYEAPVLTKEQLTLLLLAAHSDWSQVDPSIFGTLLERALNPKERHRLGAHYTPRAYVERLVKPTIEEPLRSDWDLVRAEVQQLVDQDKLLEAQKRVLNFHHILCGIRVLDPACGTGNFLYVTLDLFKRLESDVLALLSELDYRQIGLEMERYRVTPEQFLGIEVKRWAKEIAELVLWIGYLQWQVRQPGGALTVPQPVLRDYGNIECRDAVLAYDNQELLHDERGEQVTRWDGETTKVSPVTGERIPDDAARTPVLRYLNPRRAQWPEADFIIGNPPYIGNKKMRLSLGDGYVEALRSVHCDVPETADYVMYWWNQAAHAVGERRTRRSGLITTNSISQSFGRKILERHLRSKAVGLYFVVPDHPWVDSADGAAVRVALTVLGPGAIPGRLARVVSEQSVAGDGAALVQLSECAGYINSNLSVGADPTLAVELLANRGISYMGVIPVGLGFRIEEGELAALGLVRQNLPPVVRRYKNGRDVAENRPDRLIIDFFGFDENEVRLNYPLLYQRLLLRVKPERDKCRRLSHRKQWWIFGEARPAMRRALDDIERYIATVETSKHRYFVFVESQVLPDQKLRVVAHSDAWILGVLSSGVHLAWASIIGSTLEDRPVWNNTTCFDPFPFPSCSEESKHQIRVLGEALDSHRKRRQKLYPELTITDMYNVLEKLRSDEPLGDKDRVIHEKSLASILKRIHDELNVAVFDAYGWSPTLSDQEIVERLVALNIVRAEEEIRGVVRWLRPEFQNSKNMNIGALRQEALSDLGNTDRHTTQTAKVSRSAWPKDLPARVVAVRNLLVELREVSADDVLRRFKGGRAGQIENLLESLAAVGLAVENTSDSEGARRWSLLR